MTIRPHECLSILVGLSRPALLSVAEDTHVAVRLLAVTVTGQTGPAGQFVLPPFEVSCMYDPGVFSIKGSGKISVVAKQAE